MKYISQTFIHIQTNICFSYSLLFLIPRWSKVLQGRPRAITLPSVPDECIRVSFPIQSLHWTVFHSQVNKALLCPHVTWLGLPSPGTRAAVTQITYVTYAFYQIMKGFQIQGAYMILKIHDELLIYKCLTNKKSGILEFCWNFTEIHGDSTQEHNSDVPVLLHAILRCHHNTVATSATDTKDETSSHCAFTSDGAAMPALILWHSLKAFSDILGQASFSLSWGFSFVWGRASQLYTVCMLVFFSNNSNLSLLQDIKLTLNGVSIRV